MRIKDLGWGDISPKSDATANPAANTDPASVTVTKRTLLTGLFFTHVSDGNGANRYPYLTVWTDGTNVTHYFFATTPQTANLTQNWSFVPGTGQGGVIGDNLAASVGFGLPVEIPVGGKFQIRILNKQATDDTSLLRYAFKEWPL